MSSISLSKTEQLGLQLLALANKGLLSSFNCSTCVKQDYLNCSLEDSDRQCFSDPVFGLRLCSCPYNFITPELADFVDDYVFLDEFPHTMEAKGKVLPRFWLMYKTYKSNLNKIENYKHKKEMNKNQPRG